MTVEYSKNNFQRSHLLYLKNKEVKSFDLTSKDRLLKYEHDAFFNYLVNKESKICTLDNSLSTIQALNCIYEY